MTLYLEIQEELDEIKDGVVGTWLDLKGLFAFKGRQQLGSQCGVSHGQTSVRRGRAKSLPRHLWFSGGSFARQFRSPR
ncbi:hypothetical protein WN982_10785 [Paraburkholderia sp. IMGN_8]|uniref:hypothetical protein n=1 Tax=Paraburkholderia sp. IMGN_8 TaxID=3136564 RepID=UPI00310187D7